MKIRRVLITGASGFIGSNLCEYMLEKGYAIIGLDNFATGHKYNIQSFQDNQNFTFIEGDLRNKAICFKSTKGVDFVLHQATLGSVPRSLKYPITSNEVNGNVFF